MAAKRVLVTGGARGIGKAIVDIFQSKGYTIYAPTRSEMDLADEGSVQKFISTNLDADFDILINNAAENIIAPLTNLSLADWKRMQTINLLTPFILTQYVSRHMSDANWGRIINISSAYSSISRAGRAGYGTTKAGINSLTRSAAIELAEHNILVNAVAPGFVETDLTRKNNPPEQIDALKRQVPLGRLATPEEVAKLVYFLGSEENTYITGQVVFIDGGFMAQ